MGSLSWLTVVLIVLAIAAVVTWSSRLAAKRAESKSATAVEAAKLAIVTATTHQRQDPRPKHESARWSAAPTARVPWA